MSNIVFIDGAGGGSVSYGWASLDFASPTQSISGALNRLYTVSPNVAANSGAAHGPIALSGKTYWEVLIGATSTAMYRGVGVHNLTNASVFGTGTNSMVYGTTAGGCGLANPNGGYNNSSVRTSNASYAFASGDILGVAFDASTQELWFSKNGVWISGDPGLGTSPTMTCSQGASTYYPYSGWYSCGTSGGTYTSTLKAASGEFSYPAPSGFSPYDPT